MKKPKQCKSIEDIREAIDILDKELVEILGRRLIYAKEALRFKSNTRSLRDKPRIKEMLKARSDWACNNGLDIRFVIKLYKDIVKYSIQEQKKEL